MIPYMQHAWLHSKICTHVSESSQRFLSLAFFSHPWSCFKIPWSREVVLVCIYVCTQFFNTHHSFGLACLRPFTVCAYLFILYNCKSIQWTLGSSDLNGHIRLHPWFSLCTAGTMISLCSLNLFTKEQYPFDLSLLPELHHCAGEVTGVWDAVVGVAAVCVPGITTTLPWQLLKIKKKKREKNHTDSSFYLDYSPTAGSHSLWLKSSQDHDTHWDFMLFSEEWKPHRQTHLSIPCVRH